MELRHLRYFVAVAEYENVSRAALKLRIAQPAVSRQIRDLEEELGVALFERTAKALHLTGPGRIFLIEARAVLQRAAEAVETVRRQAGVSRSELRVGYAPSLSVRILPRALRMYQKSFPAVRVLLNDLATEPMLRGVADGDLDLAIGVRPPKSFLSALRFVELERYAVCALLPLQHPLARSGTVTVNALAGEPLAAYCRAEYPEYQRYLDSVFAKSKTKPRIVEEHDGVASLTAAVEAGRVIAVAPACLEALVAGRLRLIPIDPPPPQTVVGITVRRTAPSAHSTAFVESAKAACNAERAS